jgi:hypothetical protein
MANPVPVSFFGANAVMIHPNNRTRLITQTGLLPLHRKWLSAKYCINYGYNRQQLKEIESLVEDHNELVSAWKQHFSRSGNEHLYTWRMASGTRP